ncbi:chanoclavine-I dehydrogenase [Microdochium nivale]|nr:chanoclavine-I dehydrogenase [Microdochium nivale]
MRFGIFGKTRQIQHIPRSFRTGGLGAYDGIRASFAYPNVAGLPQTWVTPSQPALLHQDDESWGRIIGVNLSSVMYCTRAAVREMVKMPKDSRLAVVNVSSIGAYIHGLECYAYSASKAACSSFSSSVAKDVYSSGIRVNAVCPGNTLTGMTKEFFNGLDEDALKASFGSMGVPTTMLDPMDITRAIVFLLSEQSLHINGVNLPVGEGMP